jgi:hypothetical protein
MLLMPVQHVAAQVVEVLTRAESLFTAPAEGAAPTSAAADTMGQAAEASRAITTRATELSGALGSAHAEMLEATAQRLERATAADVQLTDQLRNASRSHGDDAVQAGALRGSAGEVPDRMAPWAGHPAGELAGLKALRHCVAGMQLLLARHSEEATRVAGEIRTLGYQQ